MRGATVSNQELTDRLKAVEVEKAASAVRLLAQIKRQIESGDYSLAQDTCEMIYHQLEAAKQASNRLADMLDGEVRT